MFVAKMLHLCKHRNMAKRKNQQLVVDKEVEAFLEKWLPHNYYVDLEKKLNISRFKIVRVKMGEREDPELARILVEMAVDNKRRIESQNAKFNEALKKQILKA